MSRKMSPVHIKTAQQTVKHTLQIKSLFLFPFLSCDLRKYTCHGFDLSCTWVSIPFSSRHVWPTCTPPRIPAARIIKLCLRFRILLLCFGIILLVFCCFAVKQRQEAEGRTLRSSNSPSVYVIPIYEEEEDEEVMDTYEAYFQDIYRDPPVYSTGNISPPPPYMVLLLWSLKYQFFLPCC